MQSVQSLGDEYNNNNNINTVKSKKRSRLNAENVDSNTS